MDDLTSYWLCWTRGTRRHLTTDPEGTSPTLCGRPILLMSISSTTGKPIAFASHWDDNLVCQHCRPRWAKATTPTPTPETIEARRQRLGLAL